MRRVAVIGKNFGDEGKGMAVDHLSLSSPRPLVVRHNGGAQSGHTVERRSPETRRFVFRELSSGSICRADTLWASGYHPDLLKLGEEIGAFYDAFGFIPRIYAMEDTSVTVPDDVLINMALETSRGDKRHGSCGMGINECDLRTGSGRGLKLGDLRGMSSRELRDELLRLRSEYTSARLKELEGIINAGADEYLSLLCDENVLINAAEIMADNLGYVEVLKQPDLEDLLGGTGTLIFESGQGLMLDTDNEEYAPHLTPSNTGLVSVRRVLDRIGGTLDEAVYVSRSYVTRHGAGRLDNECAPDRIGRIEKDRTNETNEWQGQLRYARHESEEAFAEEVRKDLRRSGLVGCRVSLFLTHLNETDNSIALKDRLEPLDRFISHPSIRETFDGFYFSDTPYTEDIRRQER